MNDSPSSINSADSAQETKKSSPKIGAVTIAKTKHLALVDSAMNPFRFEGRDMIVTSISGSEAMVAEIDGIRLQEKPIKIKWLNGEPEVVFFMKQKYLVVVSENGENKIRLLGQDGLYLNKLFPYPIRKLTDSFENKVIFIRENKTFLEAYSPNDRKTNIYHKKGDKIYPIKFSGKTISDNTKYTQMPEVGKMFHYGDTLFNWDEKDERFKAIVIGDIHFTCVRESRVYDDGNVLYEITLNGRRIPFSPSIANPKIPETLTLNGNVLLVENVQHLTIKGHKAKRVSIISQGELLGDQVFPGDITNIGGRDFLPLGDGRYTDGKKVYTFEMASKKKVLTVDFEGKKHPVLSTRSFGIKSFGSDEGTENKKKVLYIPEYGECETSYLLNNELYSESKKLKKGEKKEKYTRLKLEGIGDKHHIIGISAKHGVVCAASDTNNTSRFEFFRITSDGSVKRAYRDNYHFSLDSDSVKIKSHGRDENATYKLVRRKGTSSILEPLIIDNENYLVAEDEKTKATFLIKIGDGYVITKQELDIDNDSFEPKNSFELNASKMYYDSLGKALIKGVYYQMVNTLGKFVTDPKNAIISINGIQALLYVDSRDEIKAYIPNSERHFKTVQFYKQIEENSFSSEGKREVKKVNIGGNECILRYDYEKYKALGIIEGDLKAGFSTRYVSNSQSEGVKEFTLKVMPGESSRIHIPTGGKVQIVRILSDEYMNDKDSLRYYRKDFKSEIKHISLPKGATFDQNFICPYVNEGDGKHFLKISAGKLVPISERNNNIFLLNEEPRTYTINGEKIDITNAWCSVLNRVLSFTIKDGFAIPYVLGGFNVFLDDNELILININVPQVGTLGGTRTGKMGINDSYKVSVGNEFNVYKKNGSNPGIYIGTEWDDIKDGFQEVIGIAGVEMENRLYANKVYRTMCAIYWQGKETSAVDMRSEGFEVRLEDGGKNIVNGVEYNRKFLKALYDMYAPIKSTKTVKESVAEKVNSTL